MGLRQALRVGVSGCRMGLGSIFSRQLVRDLRDHPGLLINLVRSLLGLGIDLSRELSRWFINLRDILRPKIDCSSLLGQPANLHKELLAGLIKLLRDFLV